MLLVIGYGSLVRGDDGIGQILAKAACAQLPYTDTITCTQLTPELAEPISAADVVVFIDARTEGNPGVVSRQPVYPTRRPTSGNAFTHNVTPETLLRAARDLYGSAPEALLISVVGASFDYDADLSPQLRYAMPLLVDTVQSWLAEYLPVTAAAAH